jgi:hypothetical protein
MLISEYYNDGRSATVTRVETGGGTYWAVELFLDDKFFNKSVAHNVEHAEDIAEDFVNQTGSPSFLSE